MSLVKEIMAKLNRHNPTPLERKKLGELAKKTGKTPPVPKREKKTKIASFTFDPRHSVWIDEIQKTWFKGVEPIIQTTPGGVFGFAGTGYTSVGIDPASSGTTGNRLQEANIGLATEIIKEKHGITIEWVVGMGDYIDFYARGVGTQLKMSMTQIATLNTEGLIGYLEAYFQLSGNHFALYAAGKRMKWDGEALQEIKKDKRTAAEVWADEWEKKHEKDNGSV